MTKRKKICMVTLPNINYDSRILNEAESLSKDYDVVILNPKYSTSREIGQKKFFIKFVNCPKRLKWTEYFSPLFKLVNLFLLAKAADGEKADFYHGHDLYGLFCVYRTAKKNNCPVVYDSHELWSNVTLFGGWKLFRPIFALIEKFLAPKANVIITVNDLLASYLRKIYHKPTLSIYNFPKVKHKNVYKNLKKDFPYHKLIVYIGAWRQGRAIDLVLEAAKQLDHSFKFVFIGYGINKDLVEKITSDKDLRYKIIIKEPVPPEQLIDLVRNSEVGLCLIENVSKSYYWSSPNKLFQYLAAEVPVLGSNFPEFKKFIGKNKVGELIDPSDFIQITHALQKMVKLTQQKIYNKNLANLAKEKYNWQKESLKLQKLYRSLV